MERRTGIFGPSARIVGLVVGVALGALGLKAVSTAVFAPEPPGDIGLDQSEQGRGRAKNSGFARIQAVPQSTQTQSATQTVAPRPKVYSGLHFAQDGIVCHDRRSGENAVKAIMNQDWHSLATLLARSHSCFEMPSGTAVQTLEESGILSGVAAVRIKGFPGVLYTPYVFLQ